MNKEQNIENKSSYLLQCGWRTIGDDQWLPPGVPNNMQPVSTKGACEIQLYAEELKDDNRRKT